jgi:protein-S-isoprenylcysteine O-methyltransferase Ste14
MEMYGKHSKSIPQKSIILGIALVCLWFSYRILFREGEDTVREWFGIEIIRASYARRMIIFFFSLIVTLRIGFTMIYLLKRKISWEEAFSIPMAFALYYIGFALLGLSAEQSIGIMDYAGIFIFLTGSFLNTASELQRDQFKKDTSSKGKLFTGGLFKYSMHINYFGDLLWVTGYAVLTRNWYSAIIVILLFCFFVFYNIPALDHHLRSKYGEDFEDYDAKTKKLIPFVY